VSINLNGYTFEGPHGAISNLEDRSGVYAILTKNGERYSVLDIGESAKVKERIKGHERAEFWRRHAISGIYCAVYYTPNLQQSRRMQIEQKLRAHFDPPCGKQ
jgi:hypothetical protein